MGAVDVEAHGRHRWMSQSVIDAHIPCGALSLYHAIWPCAMCAYWLIFMSGCHPKYVCHLTRPSALLSSAHRAGPSVRHVDLSGHCADSSVARGWVPAAARPPIHSGGLVRDRPPICGEWPVPIWRCLVLLWQLAHPW